MDSSKTANKKEDENEIRRNDKGFKRISGQAIDWSDAN